MAEHAEPVSGFRSQAIFSEWMRMPNMSHRAPTLNSEKETSRKSFSFWQSVIARALRSYLCATVCTLYTALPMHVHTHTHTGTYTKKKKNATHIVHTNPDTCIAYCMHTHRHAMLCAHISSPHMNSHDHVTKSSRSEAVYSWP